MSSSTEAQCAASGVTPPAPSLDSSVSSPVQMSSTPSTKDSNGVTCDASIEASQTKFINSPGYIVPAPSFSYNVVPRPCSASSTESSTIQAPKLSPLAVGDGFQPQVSSASRPDFSYNVVPNTNVAPSHDQKLQLSTVTDTNQVQSSSCSSQTTTTLQPPIPSGQFIPGASVSHIQAPVQLPFPVPKVHSPVPMGYSVNRSSPSTGSVESPQKNQPANTTSAPESSNASTSAILGTAGTSGQQVTSRALLPSTPVRVISLDPSASIRPMHPSLPVLGLPPQVHWFHSPQVGGLQRTPFPTYPGVLPGSYAVPNLAAPLVPLPDSQPPGVPPAGSIVVHPGRTSTFSMHPIQPGVQLPSHTDLDRKASEPSGKEVGSWRKEDVDAWTAHKTSSGVVYYYNVLTGESTYDKPANYKGEPDKVRAQPSPVSWEKLNGTDWVLVTTNDGKKYYSNSKTKVSSWQIPPDVAELRKKQETGSLNVNATSLQNFDALADKGSTPNSLNAPAVATGGRDATPLRPSGGAAFSSALDLVKKKLQDSGATPTSSPLQLSTASVASNLEGPRSTDSQIKLQQNDNNRDKLKEANGDQNLSDSSSDSDDIDGGPSKEECIIQFKDMLKERGVAPFSKWDKELPKILFDPRFKAIPSYSARRAIFEQYVRTRAEEERKEKRAAQKAAIEGFKRLLEDASEDINEKTDYQTFKRTWGKDKRFEALERKDRELLLNEKILPLKKASAERRLATACKFKSMLKEKGVISTVSRWSRVKDSLRDDPRYRCIKHEERETLFNEYISELKAAEVEAERISKAKRDEQEKLKEREREMRKRKEREEQEMERIRLKVRRKEAVTSYQALLVETIKDPKASWTESKPKLEKDPQGRATNLDLEKAETEKLFREHVKALYERCVREFRLLLAEVITVDAASKVLEDGKTILTSWSTAKRLLKADARYSKVPSKDREALWRRYADEIQRKMVTSTSIEQKQTTELDTSFNDASRKSPQRRNHGRR